MNAEYTETEIISVLLEQDSLNFMMLSEYGKLLVAAICKTDKAVILAELSEQ